MAFGESAGILFKIKGDASDAVRAFNQTEAAQAGLTGATAGLTSSFSSLAGPALLAGAAVTVIATAAIAGVKALFDLTKSTAEFGSTIFDASQKTGLSAERLSAMKFAADQSGTSLEVLTAGTARFARVMGEAANGSEAAEKKLARLGVTSTDLDTALKQALATIVKVPPGAQQMALAMDAFGRSGADLLPFIKSFDGDLDKLTAKAKELGVTITDEAAAAADEFGDQLDTLNAQFAGVGRTIGFAFMPIFQDMARGLSDFLSRNQGEMQQWGTNASNIIRGVMVTMQQMDTTTQNVTQSSAASWLQWSNRMLIALNPVAFALVQILGYFREVGAASGGAKAGLGGQIRPGLGVGVDVGGGRGGGGRADNSAQREAEKAAREAERAAAKDLAAQIKIEAGNLKTVQEQLSIAFDKITKDLLGSDVKAVQQALLKFTEQWVTNLLASLDHLDELERQQLDADASENERAALRQAQDERRHKIKLQFAAEIKKTEDETFKDQLKQGEILAELAQRYFDEEMERLEQKKAALDAMLPGLSSLPPILTPDGAAPEDYNPFQGWIDGWTRFVDQVYADAPTLTQTFQTLGGMFVSAFQGMAQAIGGVVQQWVLYGETGPAVMRKILASALATIAAEAAVRALWELALGFASLFFNPAEAVAHFTAAAIFGTIAGVAAIAGRAVAGNAFQQQTNQATGSTGTGSRSTSGQGQAYSSHEGAYIQEESRSSPLGVQVQISFKDKPEWFSRMFEAEWRTNGRVRRMVEDGR